jgi:hypothetical protein
MLAPEEGHGVEAFAAAEDVARRRLALALGHDPVLDADALAAVRIGPARDVAGGEDAGGTGLEILVDGDALVGGEADGLGRAVAGRRRR